MEKKLPNKKKILIIDDEQDITEMLSSFFQSRGYEAITAGSASQALRQVETRPDLILLDINMPGEDGFSLCGKIRDFINCPILFLTARVEDADKVRAFLAGGDDYIVKPFSLLELEARVAAHLRREQRNAASSLVKFTDSLVIDYGRRKVFSSGRSFPSPKKILPLSACFPKIPARSLIGNAFTNESGDMTPKAAVPLWRSISAKYAAYLRNTAVRIILKPYGEWDIHGKNKTHFQKTYY